MTTFAILPLRSLRDGKRRLRSVLPDDERLALVRHVFEHTLRTIREAGVVDRIYVVSPDADVLAWLQRFRVSPVSQPNQGLNAGLEYARQALLTRYQPDMLMVVLPDLPLIEPSNVKAIVGMGVERTAVLAPDRHNQGTNVLLIRPADALPFCFGAGSLAQHIAAAYARGLAVSLYRAPGTAFDVDVPDDLVCLQQLGDNLPSYIRN